MQALVGPNSTSFQEHWARAQPAYYLPFIASMVAAIDGFHDFRYIPRSLSELLPYQAQVSLLRDIFGNPFRPVSFAAEWRTSTAVALAQGMYDSRDFSAMPILADALQDAGCAHADVLTHCRDEKQVHVRGCWVVDLVLGKE